MSVGLCSPPPATREYKHVNGSDGHVPISGVMHELEYVLGLFWPSRQQTSFLSSFPLLLGSFTTMSVTPSLSDTHTHTHGVRAHTRNIHDLT